MTDLDTRGMLACTSLADLIQHVVAHPDEPVPMPIIRNAVQAQTNYSISYAIAHLAEICAQVNAATLPSENSNGERHNQPEPS